MSLDKRFTDSESEARAPGMLLATVSCPVEALKHIWQFVGSDAWSIVRHREDKQIFSPLGQNVYFALAIDQGVGYEIVKDDLDTCTVNIYQRQVGRNVH